MTCAACARKHVQANDQQHGERSAARRTISGMAKDQRHGDVIGKVARRPRSKRHSMHAPPQRSCMCLCMPRAAPLHAAFLRSSPSTYRGRHRLLLRRRCLDVELRVGAKLCERVRPAARHHRHLLVHCNASRPRRAPAPMLHLLHQHPIRSSALHAAMQSRSIPRAAHLGYQRTCAGLPEAADCADDVCARARQDEQRPALAAERRPRVRHVAALLHSRARC